MKPIITHLNETTNKSQKYDLEEYYFEYPKFLLGFNMSIHSNKQQMEMIDNKQKNYLVLNPFEHIVDNYPDSIDLTAIKYFNIKSPTPHILNRSFYKLWELMFYFDVINTSEKKFTSTHIGETSGGFLQATMFFRNMFSKFSKNDKYNAISHVKSNPNTINEKFINYYKKKNNIIYHGTSDLTSIETINSFEKSVKNNIDFITADGGFECINENTQEQESLKLILAEILMAIKIQKKGGNFICKFFETFTYSSVRLISILSQLYKNVFIIKPLMSRPSNSEKYVVCINFKFDKKNTTLLNIQKKLTSILEKNLMFNFELLPDITKKIIYINSKIANKQIENISNIINFVHNGNFYGEIYNTNRNKQIEANKYWIKIFFNKSSSDAKKLIKLEK